ncbi:MAG: hypothetical protein AABX11_06445 [Nanoarchaeota archaeon]
MREIQSSLNRKSFRVIQSNFNPRTKLLVQEYLFTESCLRRELLSKVPQDKNLIGYWLSEARDTLKTLNNYFPSISPNITNAMKRNLKPLVEQALSRYSCEVTGFELILAQPLEVTV